MSAAYVFDTVLTSSLLIFFFYICFATLIICFAYLLEDEIREFFKSKRERRIVRGRSEQPVDAVVDDIYDSY